MMMQGAFDVVSEPPDLQDRGGRSTGVSVQAGCSSGWCAVDMGNCVSGDATHAIDKSDPSSRT